MHAGPAPCRLVLAAAGFLSSLPGCAVGTYLRDRALDMTDIVDPQVGLGFGPGVKVEVSDYVGVGLGWAVGGGLEFYGRRATRFGGMFVQAPLCGVNELPFDAGGPIEDDFLLYQRKYLRAPAISRARIGASVLPFLGYLGLYLNLGEALDLVAGLVGLDPADDDGVPKGAEMELRVTLHDGWPPKPIGGTESRESQGTRGP